MVVEDFDEFVRNLDEKNIVLSPFCGLESCEEKLKEDSSRYIALTFRMQSCPNPYYYVFVYRNVKGDAAVGAKSLCIPFEQENKLKPDAKCIRPMCTNKPQYYCLFGRSF